MMKGYIKAISPYTLYIFASSKLLIWSFSMIFLHASRATLDVLSLTQLPATKYILLALSLCAFGAIKLQKYLPLFFSALAFLFVWSYAMISLGMARNWFHNVHFLCLLVETVFIMYMTVRICHDRGMRLSFV